MEAKFNKLIKERGEKKNKKKRIVKESKGNFKDGKKWQIERRQKTSNPSRLLHGEMRP